MPGQIRQPGVEIIQEFVSASPSFSIPSLLSCSVGPAFRIVKAFTPEGAVDADSIAGAYPDTRDVGAGGYSGQSSGVASTPTTHLVDTTQSWVDDELNGKYVFIWSGTGAGQLREILDTDNALQEIEVSVAWDVTLDATSKYYIGDGIEVGFPKFIDTDKIEHTDITDPLNPIKVYIQLGGTVAEVPNYQYVLNPTNDGIIIGPGAGNVNFPVIGTILVEWLGLRTDISETLVVAENLEDLDNFLGPISVENPLAWGMAQQLSNSQTNAVAGLGVNDIDPINEPDGTVASYQEALDALESEDVYAISTLTHALSVHQSLSSHVTALSASTEKKERIGFVNPLFPTNAADQILVQDNYFFSASSGNPLDIYSNVDFLSSLALLGVNPVDDLANIVVTFESELHAVEHPLTEIKVNSLVGDDTLPGPLPPLASFGRVAEVVGDSSAALTDPVFNGAVSVASPNNNGLVDNTDTFEPNQFKGLTLIKDPTGVGSGTETFLITSNTDHEIFVVSDWLANPVVGDLYEISGFELLLQDDGINPIALEGDYVDAIEPYWVYIMAGGAAAGQFRKIIGSSSSASSFANTLLLELPWTIVPDAEPYEIWQGTEASLEEFKLVLKGDLLVINGFPNKALMATTIAGFGEAYKNRRLFVVIPDQVEQSVAGVTSLVEGYYLASAICGMVGQLPPQQGFTNYPVTGFLGVNNKTSGFFSTSQLDTIAGGGVYTVIQNAQGQPLICRHQLSTDVSVIEKRELSITKVVDYTAKFLRNLLVPYIGLFNINQGFLDNLSTIVQGALRSLVDANILNGADLNIIAQDEDSPDTVIIDVTLDVPFPANYIRLTLLI
ncbi:hypothetical protein LCGC14_0146790 [marine sediment metagenome]|uniref:Tail sheath protein C-terminal domain-containing protein n=1 Tax=marine sediment metagenome TaxID=412755 RepID=A0A0F9VFJ8_9ZZZZ